MLRNAKTPIATAIRQVISPSLRIARRSTRDVEKLERNSVKESPS